MYWRHLFETDLGWLGLLVEDRQVVALTFGSTTRHACLERLEQQAEELGVATSDLAESSCQQTFANECEQRLREFATGGAVDLSRIPARLHARTPFQSRVLQACRGIPRGETLTYQQLAQLAGSPQASRAVGNIMARNRIPLLIPCHRVVASNGGLGGFSAPQGVSMKQRLLDLESADTVALT